MNDMKDYMISKNKAEEYEKKKAMADSVYAKGKARVYPQAKRVKELDDVILDAVVAEIRSIICAYQDTMSKDFEQCLKNLIDQIEGYKQ